MKLITLTLLTLLCSCGENRNTLMTNLVNEKKSAEDSISLCENNESYFLDQAKKSHDSMVYKPLIDSSGNYFGIEHRLKERLTQIDFSIDSLSKMK